MNAILNWLKVAGLLLSIESTAESWSPQFNARKNSPFKFTKLFSSSSSITSLQEDSTKSLSTSIKPPSWEDLSTHLQNLQNENEKETPLITLYRDTNGWCPFCERVWLALKIKNIPYQETLISLFDKPKWFVDMVPTGLVPVVLIHTDVMEKEKMGTDNNDDAAAVAPQRTMIWESMDILKALDEYFPDTPKLIRENDGEYDKGQKILDECVVAGFKYSYNMRNETLTEDEKAQQRKDFEAQLDILDAFIGKNSESPFFLDDVSALDIQAIPNLERWRYQLPLIKNMDISQGRDNLKKWFDAMDKYEPYIQRVAGDQYSWSAVASTFLKLFGAGQDGISEETKNAISRAEEAAEELRSQFDSNNPHDNDFFSKKLLEEGKIEAASKLISNHEAIVKDSTNKDPSSQKELERANDEYNADWIIRLVTSKLLSIDCTSGEPDDSIDVKDAAKAAKIVASRLSVPRDMGAPAGAILRNELTKTASQLEL